ncbi:MAG TPA: aldehyde dehydrogenase family protein [Phycisphaerales bacterium]|nr:aldehyde dehydrogenase family protein [Phycisphaerales bacterium]
MADRLAVTKTFKLFIGGAFPRSESGQTLTVPGPGGAPAHVARASRKDLRDAVSAARAAQPGWGEATAYLRGQILYRAAEMLEAGRAQFEALLPGAPGAREVDAAVDRLVCFAGWADKHAQVLGCNNPVAGPYYNFTAPEPTGVVAVVAPDECPLLALVSLLAPALCAGNAVVALGSEASPLPAAVLGEILATSDFPPGVVNLLTGRRAELVPVIAGHRDIDAVHAANLPMDQAAALRAGTGDNVKRVTVRGWGGPAVDWFDAEPCQGPEWIEPLVELKTVWHPSAT